MHRRAAAALEEAHGADLEPYLAELAHHVAQAGFSGDLDRAIEYGWRAGEHAIGQSAYEQAVTHFRRTVELIEAADRTLLQRQRCDLVIAQGEAERQAGDPAYRQTLLSGARLAQELHDPERLARAVLANNRGIYSSGQGVDRERVSVLQAALDAYDIADSPTRAELLALLALELVTDPDLRLRDKLSDDAVAMARRVGDPRTLARVLTQRCAPQWTPTQTLAERQANLREAGELADRLKDPLLAGHVAYLGAQSAMNAGDLEEADRLLPRLTAIAEQLAQPFMRWYDLVARAKRCLISGPAEEAERLAFAAWEVGRRGGQPDSMLWFAGQVIAARFLQGALDRSDPHLPDLIQTPGATLPVSPEITPIPTAPLLSAAAMSAILCEVGRLDDARRHFDLLMSDGLDDLPPDYQALMIPVYASIACARLGDVRRAERLHEILEPQSHRLVPTGAAWFGATTHYLGLLAATLGRSDEADARFAAAERTYASLDAKPWLARLRNDWTAALFTRRRGGDDRRAEQLLERAAAGGSGERRRVALTELETDSNEDTARVVAPLTDRRMLTISEGTIELAHDARPPLSRHFAEAAPVGNATRDVDYAASAGVRALELMAYDQAIEFFGAALRTLELGPQHPKRRGTILLALGQAELHTGRLEASRATLRQAAEDARQLGDSELLAQVALTSSPWDPAIALADEKELMPLIQEAADRLALDDSALHAQLLARMAAAMQRSATPTYRESLANEAIAMARRVDDPTALAFVLTDAYRATWAPNAPDRSLTWASEIYALARRLGDTELALISHSQRMSLLLELGGLTTIDHEIDTFERIAGRQHQQRAQALALLHRCGWAIIQGRFAEAETLLGQATPYATSLQHDPFLTTRLGALAFVMLQAQGRLDELKAGLGHFADSYPTMPVWRCGLLCVYLQSGREAELRDDYEGLADEDFKTLPRENSWLPTVALLAEVCAHLGDRANAGVLRSMLTPYAGRNVIISEIAYIGPVDRYLALLAVAEGDNDAAANWFASARELAERIGARPTSAQLALDEARWLQRQDPLRAADAIAGAKALGLDRLATRAREIAMQQPRTDQS
jgi:ATP/maltotriose-dependent transcriptional regulator MalT